jgi:hypothetical protein
MNDDHHTQVKAPWLPPAFLKRLLDYLASCVLHSRWMWVWKPAS